MPGCARAFGPNLCLLLTGLAVLACSDEGIAPAPVDAAQTSDQAAAPENAEVALDAGAQPDTPRDAAKPSADPEIARDASMPSDARAEAAVALDAASSVDAPDANRGEAGAMVCNTLRTTGRGISLRASSEQPPERQQGGAIRDGTYRLSDGVIYDPSRAGGVPEMRVETLVVRGDVWQRVAYWDAQPTSNFSQRASLHDASFRLQLTCGTEFDAQVFGLLRGDEGLYSARGDELVLQMQGGGERGTIFVLTYTRVAD